MQGMGERSLKRRRARISRCAVTTSTMRTGGVRDVVRKTCRDMVRGACIAACAIIGGVQRTVFNTSAGS